MSQREIRADYDERTLTCGAPHVSKYREITEVAPCLLNILCTSKT
jgi:hypothetical protein